MKNVIKTVFFITSAELVDINNYHKLYRNYMKKVLEKNLDVTKSSKELLDLRNRTWGFFPTLKSAKKEVTNNGHFYYECGTPWVCIEEVYPGTIAIVKRQYFYQWNNDENKYVRIKNWPEKLKKYFDDRHLLPQLLTVG